MTTDPVQQATQIQQQAAQPNMSVSLRASAGSGKTKVLVDRFIRLCVDDSSFQADPRSILAITFTRKAAVEIQERLLERSRQLALADEAELKEQLTELFGSRGRGVSAAEMTAAASLYEKVLEDLSGLNVGTIHHFCQVILGRFAAEAGLDPHATLLENTDDLVEEALDLLDKEMAADPELAAAGFAVGKDPGSVRLAVRNAQKQGLRLDRWARSLQPHPDPDSPLDRVSRLEVLPLMVAQLELSLLEGMEPGDDDRRAYLLARMKEAVDTFLNDGIAAIEGEMQAGIPAAQLKSLHKSLENKLRAPLRQWQAGWQAVSVTDGPEPAQDLKAVFQTTAGTMRKFSSVKKDGWGPLFNGWVVQQAQEIFTVLRLWMYLELLDKNASLLRLTLRVMDICDELKRRDQVIDFQDLEDLACRLMSDDARAISLLYRLDDSINHILLDEFQDTNFNQWDMLEPLVEEFLSGGSDPNRTKTIFAVGDVKQSIYGFRGAEPELFPRVTEYLTARGQLNLVLPTNFRSLPDVVGSTGCVFSAPPLSEYLPPGEAGEVTQDAARSEAPGLVVVLNPQVAEEPGQGDEQLLDDEPGLSGNQLAARQAARLARHLVDSGEKTWSGYGDSLQERSLNWDDILVLSRTRTDINLYEKAFREEGIPLLPSGRGTLATRREVQDILALLRWLVYPQDEVALATTLRSPLFRLSEADFQAALSLRQLTRTDSNGRLLPPDNLWATLRRHKDDPRFAEAVGLLRKWRGHLGQESSHDLLRRIFRQGQVLSRFEAALGSQARHNLLRLFDLALSHQVTATPTVRRLVEFIDRAARQSGEEEAVTPPGESQGRVSFMTIHGAKGLERAVVILVDADNQWGKDNPQLRLEPDNDSSPLLFKVNKDIRQGIEGAALPPTQLEVAVRQARERGTTEDANLLYVAMTRARDRLYVLGGSKSNRLDYQSGQRLLAQAADGIPCSRIKREMPDLPLARPSRGPTGEPSGPTRKKSLTKDRARVWAPPVMTGRIKLTTPSALEQDEPSAGPTSEEPAKGSPADRHLAIEHGNRVHLLLQLAAEQGQMPPPTNSSHDPAHAEAAAVFANPDLEWVFAQRPDGGRGLSEAPVIYRQDKASGQATETRMTGVIDRLVLRPGRVDIIDYKTNRLGEKAGRLPDLIKHYQPQLLAYGQALAALHPDCEIRTWLLFTDPEATDGGRLEEVE